MAKIVPYIREKTGNSKDNSSIRELISQALLKLSWDKEQKIYIANDITLITLAREASEIGYIRITITQAEEACNDLGFEIDIIQGERYTKLIPEKLEM